MSVKSAGLSNTTISPPPQKDAFLFLDPKIAYHWSWVNTRGGVDKRKREVMCMRMSNSLGGREEIGWLYAWECHE
jgi:hypothetical protein